MARTKNTANTPAVLEDTAEEVETAETAAPTTKQIIGEGIARVIEVTGIDVQKNRYKAMRAIAFQAFQESIESGDFDALVDRALENIDSLPAGWEIERSATDTPAPATVKKAAAKPATKVATKPAAKVAAKAAAATTTRKRPTR